MFGSLGGPEILFIFALALLLFGPRQLPKIGRTFGRTLAEFRKATNDFKAGLEREIEFEELKKTQESVAAAARDVRGTIREVTGIANDAGPVDPPATSDSGPAGESATDADTQVVDTRDTRRPSSRSPGGDMDDPSPDPTDDAGTGQRP